MLFEKVLLAQSGNKDAMQELINQFKPLIKRYSRGLYIEDSYNELVLSFIEVIHTIPVKSLNSRTDGIIVKYISTSMRHSYIALIRKNAKSIRPTISWEEMTESQHNQIHSSHEPNIQHINLQNILASCSTLTKKEKEILRLVYFNGYTSAEIARHLSTSKQNVNQIKKRALVKLRKIVSPYLE